MKFCNQFLVICMLFSAYIAPAQTNVSGIIHTNTTWNIAGSPYIITGNTLISTGITLTIEPGVTVKLISSTLQIDGTIIAQGLPTLKIIFTSDSTQNNSTWGTIKMTDTSVDAIYDVNGNYLVGSIFENCVIKYLQYFALDGAHPLINACLLRNNYNSNIYASNVQHTLKVQNSKLINALYGCGILANCHNSSNMIISNDTIYNNGGSGIYIKATDFNNIATKSLITNSVIMNNGIQYIYHSEIGGIYAEGYSCIKHNIIVGNFGRTSGGISASIHGEIKDNIVYNNTVKCDNDPDIFNGAGISVSSDEIKIQKNLILNNKFINTTFTTIAEGGGIFTGNGNQICIKNNIIAKNQAKYGSAISNYYASDSIIGNIIYNNRALGNGGSTISGRKSYLMYNTLTKNLNLGYCSLWCTDNSIVNYNNIFRNSGPYEFAIANNYSLPPYFDATKNWWGTVSDSIIQLKIMDWFDDATLQIVNYNPFLLIPDTLAPISPPNNVIKTQSGLGNVQLVWFANPESDVAGYRVYWGDFTGYSFLHSIDVGSDTSFMLSGVSINDSIAVTAYDNTYNSLNDSASTLVNDNMTLGNESWFSMAMDTTNTIGIINNILIEFEIFPNPSTGLVNLCFGNNPISGKLSVLNICGQEVFRSELKWQNKTILKLEAQPKGIYFIKLQTHKGVLVKKVLLQ